MLHNEHAVSSLLYLWCTLLMLKWSDASVQVKIQGVPGVTGAPGFISNITRADGINKLMSTACNKINNSSRSNTEATFV